MEVVNRQPVKAQGAAMRGQALLGALALCAGLAGCSRVEQAIMPVAAKINAAHPLSPEAMSARERLLRLLAQDAEAFDEVNARSESRMALRALSCSKNVSIGRFDSVEAVRLLSMDASCFQAQDRELETFFSIRAIGALLSRPALRPLRAAGPVAMLPKGKLSFIISGALARDAGVGVLLDGSGNGFVAEMPGAMPIAQLPRVGSVSTRSAYVSPNGRIVVLNLADQGAVFFDAETGSRIWSAGGTGSDGLLAWLPEVSGFVMTAGNGNVLLVDGLTGSVEPHPSSVRYTSFAAHIAGPPARLLMGTARELVLVEHQRSPQGISASVIRQYAIASGPGVTSGHPIPMRSGQLVVYPSMRDIGWLDLTSGASGTWRSSPKFGIPFAKLDESRIMFDSAAPDGFSPQPWAFDITNETVAPVDLGESNGLIVDIGDRIGFLRRGNEAWFGDKVTSGEAQSLNLVVADFELQQQLAKLQAQAQADRDSRVPFVFERAAGGSSATRGTQLPPVPGLESVPANAVVHMVGVYEGKRGTGPSTGDRMPNVRILARGSDRPIVLALASYEPVNWIVTNGGARISAVLLSGYHPSTVTGVGSVPVLRIGSDYAYSAGSAEYGRLRQAVAQVAGQREIRSFQGSYTGLEFSVGGP